METKHNSDSELGMLRGVLLGEIDSEGKRLKVCLISTFIFGLIAHAYGFLHLLIGHDSLHEFYWSVSRDWKLILGRFVEPLLRYLLGEIIVLPWLAGLTGLLFVALAVHLISKMFQLNKVWETLLLSGICTTNVTVTAIIATYAHDFTGDMMALLLCTMATYAWYQMRSRFSWKYTVLGTFCLAAAFGLYQAYLAVMTTVLCIWSVLELLHGTPAKTTIMRLLRALPMILLAVVLYLACVFATRQLYHIVAFSGEPANDISVVGENLLRFKELVIQGYRQVARDLFRPHWNSVKGVHYRASALVSVVNMVLCLHTAWTLLTIIKKKALKKAQIILIFGLLLLLPLAMTCVSIISTAFHNLLRYAYYLFYLLVVAVFCVGRNTSSIKQPGRQGMLIAGLICIVLLNNVQVSNAVYEKKNWSRGQRSLR